MPNAVSVTGYVVAEELGRGGFGVVYRARQSGLDREVALKVLSNSTADGAAEARFERECHALGRVSSHPGIVTVYAAGRTDQGAPFFAMELLSGGTLAERGPLPPADVTRIGIRVAEALGVAHAAGIMHRDVKPANVLFDAAGNALLADFGIASLHSSAATITASVTASIGYAAPEVLEGAAATEASDVYGLAATLYTALSGRSPFEGSQEQSLAALVARVATRPIDDLRPAGVPGPLCQVIEKAMAKKPLDRYVSAMQFAEALAASALGEVSSEPGYRRAPAWMTMLTSRAALIGLVVLGVSGLSLHQLAQHGGAQRPVSLANPSGLPVFGLGPYGTPVASPTTTATAGASASGSPAVSTSVPGATGQPSFLTPAPAGGSGSGGSGSGGSIATASGIAPSSSLKATSKTVRSPAPVATKTAPRSTAPSPIGRPPAGTPGGATPSTGSADATPPDAPLGVSERAVMVAELTPNDVPEKMSVALSWTSPGDSSIVQYCAEYVVYSGGVADAQPVVAGCAKGTSMTVSVPPDMEGSSYVGWSVYAVDAAQHDSTPSAVNSVTVPDVSSDHRQSNQSFAILRECGFYVGAHSLGTAAAGRAYTSDHQGSTGTVVPVSSTVDLWFYEGDGS